MKYQVQHTFGSTIHEGTRHECEIVLKALSTYGVDSGKFDIIEVPVVNPLTETTRNKLKEEVAQMILQGSFGDGLERDYAWDGVVLTGANEMSDAELIEAYESGYVDEDDNLLMQAKGEFILEQVLAGEEVE